jgi:hypothetical protein
MFLQKIKKRVEFIKHLQIRVVFATKYSVGGWGFAIKTLTSGNLKLQVICKVVYPITRYNY